MVRYSGTTSKGAYAMGRLFGGRKFSQYQYQICACRVVMGSTRSEGNGIKQKQVRGSIVPKSWLWEFRCKVQCNIRYAERIGCRQWHDTRSDEPMNSCDSGKCVVQCREHECWSRGKKELAEVRAPVIENFALRCLERRAGEVEA